MTAYCASKYALAGFADALRYEMRPKGVHVAQVHPGVIDSDFMERAQFRGENAEKQRAQMESMLGSGMGGVIQKPEEIASAVLRAVECRQDEIVVGPVFKAAVQAYRLTGHSKLMIDHRFCICVVFGLMSDCYFFTDNKAILPGSRAYHLLDILRFDVAYAPYGVAHIAGTLAAPMQIVTQIRSYLKSD
eukprot:scaffold174475_cov36-Prasinocladus_malaysianus.AAC.2